MKAPIGIDKTTGLIHPVETNAANGRDLTPNSDLMHDEEEMVYANAGFPGIEKREELAAKSMEHCLAMGLGQRRALPDTDNGRLLDLMETAKVHVHVKVEHPFRVIKTKSAGSHSSIQLSEDSAAGPG